MIRRVDLISPAYLEEQKQLHAQPRGYGQKGSKWAPTVRWLLEHYGATSVLDYGCGQGSLARALREYNIAGLRIAEYDPAIEGKYQTPEFADLVVCTDVLEHIEPERLATVLAHLKLLARKAIFLVVNLRPAGKWLADGRNAHLIVESAAWWRSTVTAAGLTVVELADLPLAKALIDTPTKAAKCWVAVVRP